MSVPTKDFSDFEFRELTIHTLIKQDNMNRDHLYFILTIPQYIFQKVLGTDQQYLKERTKTIAGQIHRKIRFTNRLESETFIGLLEQFDKICHDAVQVQSVIDSTRDKVIMVKFTQSKADARDELNHATKGTKLTTNFQYFVCYQRKVKDHFSDHRRIVYESLEQRTYGLQDQHLGYGFKHYYEDIAKEFDVVRWTPEREEFFKNIQDSFLALNEKFSEFFSKLTDDKVEQLMTMHKQQALLPSGETIKSLEDDSKEVK